MEIYRQMGFWLFDSIFIFIVKPCWFRDSDRKPNRICNHTYIRTNLFNLHTAYLEYMLDESKKVANRFPISQYSNRSFISSFG